MQTRSFGNGGTGTAENPYAIGINWASSLEVAFRSLSWIWMYQLLEGTPALPPEFRKEWLQAQALNGRYIERYLSTYFSPNTHLLGEGRGAAVSGDDVPGDFSGGTLEVSWLGNRFARGAPSGAGGWFPFRAIDLLSRLRNRLLFARGSAGRSQRAAIPSEFEKTLEKMLDALLLLGRGGAPPRLGDDDGGRVFDPRRNRSEHMLDPLATGAVLFHRGDFKAVAGELPEETIWLLGEHGVAEWDRLQAQPPGMASAGLPSAGLYILTTHNPPSQLVIDAGPQGAESAGHGHADALSICLQSQGHSLLIDPGTFEYVGEGPERDLFRGTAMHNTLRVDGVSQSEPAGPFGWKQLTQTRVEQWITGKNFDLFVGSHDGYGRLASPVEHRRWIFSLKSGLYLVRDLAQGEGEHRLDIAWHLGPEMRLRAEHLFEVKGTSRGLAILCADGHGWSEEVRQGTWSPVYGRHEPITVLNFGTVTDLPAEFVTLLVPLEEARGIPGKLTQIKGETRRR